MTENDASRVRVLALYRLLFRETDEDHPLPCEKLCSLLGEQGIKVGRKTVYRDLAALRNSGVDLLFTRKPEPGFFLAGREFEPPEVRLLMDAVLSAPFITERKTEVLIRKLGSLLSSGQARETEEPACAEKRVKFDNEEIYYSIDAVTKAVSRKKKIAFEYYHRVVSGIRAVPDAGKHFVVSPYALLWDSDKYYLAGSNEKFDALSHFRLDRMKRVEILDLPARPFEEVCEYRGQFDTADYTKKTFHMYHGERQSVELRCKNEILENVLDKFGEDLHFTSQSGDFFTVRASIYISEGFVRWLLSFAGSAEVLSPESLREEILAHIRKLCDVYGYSQ